MEVGCIMICCAVMLAVLLLRVHETVVSVENAPGKCHRANQLLTEPTGKRGPAHPMKEPIAGLLVQTNATRGQYLRFEVSRTSWQRKRNASSHPLSHSFHSFIDPELTNDFDRLLQKNKTTSNENTRIAISLEHLRLFQYHHGTLDGTTTHGTPNRRRDPHLGLGRRRMTE